MTQKNITFEQTKSSKNYETETQQLALSTREEHHLDLCGIPTFEAQRRKRIAKSRAFNQLQRFKINVELHAVVHLSTDDHGGLPKNVIVGDPIASRSGDFDDVTARSVVQR